MRGLDTRVSYAVLSVSRDDAMELGGQLTADGGDVDPQVEVLRAELFGSDGSLTYGGLLDVEVHSPHGLTVWSAATIQCGAANTEGQELHECFRAMYAAAAPVPVERNPADPEWFVVRTSLPYGAADLVLHITPPPTSSTSRSSPRSRAPTRCASARPGDPRSAPQMRTRSGRSGSWT